MARTVGPLMSFDASGTIGNALVFAKWKGRNYVRRHVIPHNPKSALQTYTRALFKFLTERWITISAPDKASWATLAAATTISPFNAYLAHNMRRHSELLPPSIMYPPTGLNTTPSAPTLTITGGVHNATIEIAEGANAPDLAWFVYRKLGSAPSGIPSELVLVGPYTGNPDTFSDAPLTAGVYHYKAKGTMSDGVYGTLSADANGTVT